MIEGMLAAGYSGRLRVLLGHRLVATVDGDRITSVTLEALGEEPVTVVAPYVLDATETGSSCPSPVSSIGPARESRGDREPHAPEAAQPLNMQAAWCFAVDHLEGVDHTVDRPERYAFWREHAPSGWTGGPRSSPPGAEDPRAPGTHLHPNPDAGATVVDHRLSGATTSCGRSAASPTGGPSSPDTFASDITW